MRATLPSRSVLAALASLACGCTFTTGGFEECAVDADCGDGRICRESFCVVNQTPEGCGRVEGRADDPNAILFGAALPLTSGGEDDQSEIQGLNAFLLALEEVNQREGVAGRPFAVHVCDTGRDAEKVRTQSVWLAEQLGVPVLFTSGSSQTLPAASESIPRGVLLMTSTSTSPEITSLLDVPEGETVGLVWRTAPSDAIQGSVIADLLVNDTTRFPGVDKVGILYLNDPYGQGLADVLNAELTAAGKTVVSYVYDEGGDIDGPVAALDADDPDLTVLVAFQNDGARILNAAESSSTNLSSAAGHRWFFTDSAKDPALLTNLDNPAQVDGAFGTAPAQGAGLAYDAFEASFKSAYKVDPAQFAFTSHSYDAFYLLALGSAWAVGADGQGEVSGLRIAEGLTKMSSGSAFQLKPSGFTPARSALQQGQSIDVVGTSGDLDFDETTGEAPGMIDLWRIQGQTFEHVERRTPPGE